MGIAIDPLRDWTVNPVLPTATTVYAAMISFTGGASNYELRGTFDGDAFSMFERRYRVWTSGVPGSWTSWSTFGAPSLSSTVFSTFSGYGSTQEIELEIRLTAETPGSYTFSITTHDSGDVIVQDTLSFDLVISSSASDPPVAVIDATSLAINPDGTITFYGTGSTDPDGTIVSYEWEIEQPPDEDNNPVTLTDTGDTTTASFSAIGTYTVTLTVTDDDDLTDTATVTVTVAYATVTEAHAGQPILIRQT